MHIETTNRYDSKGFWLRGAKLRPAFHCWKPYIGKVGFLARLDFGKGAGYIGGWTAFLGWRTKGGNSENRGKSLSRLRLGITRNGNHVPYSFHC